MRPTEVPPAGVAELRDDEVPDFLERNALALLAFLDESDDVCRRLRARLDVFAATHPGAAFGVVDVRRARLVAEALGVRSVPALCVFREGALVDRIMGAPPDAVLKDVLRMRG